MKMNLVTVPTPAQFDIPMLVRLTWPFQPDPRLTKHKFLLLDEGEEKTLLIGPAYYHPYLVLLRYATRGELESLCKTLEPDVYPTDNLQFTELLARYKQGLRIIGAGLTRGANVNGWSSLAFGIKTPETLWGPITDAIQAAFVARTLP